MTKFRFLTAGESHGMGLTVILEGIPSNLSLSEEYIRIDMSRSEHESRAIRVMVES